MKSSLRRMGSNTVRLASSDHPKVSSPSLSGAPTSSKSTPLRTRSKRQISAGNLLLTGKQHVILSKSMEKSFHRLKNKNARVAYVEAELANGIAHQIRILREQRGWTQTQLARKLKTTQAAVSRLENASYGRHSLKTLLQVGAAFDVGMFLRYMPFSQFMGATWDTRPEKFEADSYDDEAPRVHFFPENSAPNFENFDVPNDVHFFGNQGWDQSSPLPSFELKPFAVGYTSAYISIAAIPFKLGVNLE